MGKQHWSSVSLSGSFLERYLAKTPPGYLAVYLLVKSVSPRKKLPVAEAAQALGQGATEVLEAALFWQKEGVLQVEDGEIYLPLVETLPPRLASRPQYDPQELSMYAAKNEEIRRLFAMAQSYLGRYLTHNDLSVIFSLRHWLELPVDVIEVLLRHCTEQNHRSCRYIEAVAIDWAESGIFTVEAAEERLRLTGVDFKKIMAAFGQSGRQPVANEEKYMKKWLQEMEMPLPLVLLACEKTVEATGKAAFAYADKILQNWKKAGLQTPEDVKREQMAFAQRKKEQKKPAEKKPATNAFGTYAQRSYDYAAFEQQQQARLKGEE